jgi:putative membrane protein
VEAEVPESSSHGATGYRATFERVDDVRVTPLSDVDSEKSESDPRPDLAYSRTHLANQRTYAAWLRTGLSVAAAGLVFAHLVPRDAVGRAHAFGFGTLFVGVGVGIVVFGAFSFHRVSDRLTEAGTPPAVATKWVVYASATGLALLLIGALLLI